MIVTEESSKSFAATDGAVSTRWCEAFWRNQPIVKTLVIPFPVIMRRECGERSAQMGFAEDDDPIQALLLNRPHEALRIRIAVGRLERRLHDANAGVGQGPSEGDAPLGVAVTDEDAGPAEYALIGASQHPSDLAYEGVVRIRRRSHEVHAARFEINHEGRVVRDQPAYGPHFCGEEIRCGDRPCGPQ